MTDLLHSPGFLGTNANFAADLTLLLSLLVMSLFSLGYYLARKGKYDTHKWVLPYRSFVIRDEGGPRPDLFYQVTMLHAGVGFLAFTLGNFVVLRGHKLVPQFLRFNNYKLFMRTAYGLYLLTTIAGVALYYTWYVIIPNPPVF
jgi:hypothetical protein